MCVVVWITLSVGKETRGAGLLFWCRFEKRIWRCSGVNKHIDIVGWLVSNYLESRTESWNRSCFIR